MTEDREPYIGQGKAIHVRDTPLVHVSGSGTGRLTIDAFMTIEGRRVSLHLPDWLDAATPDPQAVAQTALRRVALSFLEGFEPTPDR